MNALEKEMATFDDHLPEFLMSSMGKFVLIKDTEVVGIYDSYQDAMTAGYKQFALVPFLVKKVAPSEQVSFFTRDFVIPCQVSI